METTRGRTIGAGRINRAKVRGTGEADTRNHMIQDGLDPDNPLGGFRPKTRAGEVRQRTGLSQDRFARALRVPVKTIRNWEQGRSKPDPAAQSLLALVADDPERVFEVLGATEGDI